MRTPPVETPQYTTEPPKQLRGRDPTEYMGPPGSGQRTRLCCKPQRSDTARRHCEIRDAAKGAAVRTPPSRARVVELRASSRAHHRRARTPAARTPKSRVRRCQHILPPRTRIAVQRHVRATVMRAPSPPTHRRLVVGRSHTSSRRHVGYTLAPPLESRASAIALGILARTPSSCAHRRDHAPLPWARRRHAHTPAGRTPTSRTPTSRDTT